MVDVQTIKNVWLVDGEAIKQYSQDGGVIEDDEQYLFQSGIRKVKEVYLCGYCNEGFHLKKENAEECCKDRDIAF